MPPQEESMTFHIGPCFLTRFLFLHADERRHPESHSILTTGEAIRETHRFKAVVFN